MTLVSHILNGIFVFASIGFIAHSLSSGVKDIVTINPGMFWESYSGAAALSKNPTTTAVILFTALCIFIFTDTIKNLDYIAKTFLHG